MSYVKCRGSSLHPARGSVVYRRGLPVRGRCRVCNGDYALTLAGFIRAHKRAREAAL